MRNRIVTGALLIAVLAITVPAFAGNGNGNGNGNGGGGGSATSASSSISIATINGGLMATTTASPTTKLGDALTFATTVQALAGWQYPMVAVSCYQDVNGDGVLNTSIDGPDLVYAELGTPSDTFGLGGASSLWLDRGGSAFCRADLDSYGWKSGQEYVQVLKSMSWQS